MRHSLILSIFVFATIGRGARADDLSEQEIKEARKLYIAKCAKCHKFYDPSRYDDEEWQTWMTKMTRKARLKPDQAKLLSRYIDTLRLPRPEEKKTTSPQ